MHSVNHLGFSNRRRAFEIQFSGTTFLYPYGCVGIRKDERVGRVLMERRDGRDAFRYYIRNGRRALGRSGSVAFDTVTDYGAYKIPDRIRRMLAREALKRIETTQFTVRQLIKALRTSAPRFYRLLDERNDSASIAQLLTLLEVLGCEVEVSVR